MFALLAALLFYWGTVVLVNVKGLELSRPWYLFSVVWAALLFVAGGVCIDLAI